MARQIKKNRPILRERRQSSNDWTSGDMARLLHVDLKTIHNWVGYGYITGTRTSGRHLLFERTEVVRFMRGFGYPTPPSVSKAAPRVVYHLAQGAKKPTKSLGRGLDLLVCEGPEASLLAFGGGEREVFVLDADKLDSKHALKVLASIREWETTKTMGFVALSRKPATRKAFIDAGADAALAPSEADLRATILWLTGVEKAPSSKVALPPVEEE